VPARVEVQIDSRRKVMTIVDNGRGMSWSDLRNFWTMHGENIDRLAGKPGRGRFGTGKSAAFGIAETLRVTSVKAHKRSTLELRRSDILAMKSGEPIPVRTLECEVSTPTANGTRIEIIDIQLRHLSVPAAVKYIERHLAHWPKDAVVVVNNQVCEYAEPPVASELHLKPSVDERDSLGDVELLLKISKAPLEEDQRGVSSCSSGVWHETTVAGAENREMSQYIFGKIDVPALEADSGTIPAFDATRSLQLNRENPVVAALIAFIGRCVEAARRKLVDAERERRATDEAKRLERQAQEIARVLNEDFDAFRLRIAKVKAQRPGGGDLADLRPGAGDGFDDLMPGQEGAGTEDAPVFERSENGAQETSEGMPSREKKWVKEGDEPTQTQPAGGKGRKPTPRGGFDVRFAHLGEENDRSKYSAEERVIFVNLDHPQVAAAKSGTSEDDPGFRRLAYEVAFTEYAVALAYELDNRDEYREPAEAIFDIRDAINRVARRAAALYLSTR